MTPQSPASRPVRRKPPRKPLLVPDAAVRVGVDENGLGARLGPMLVTAVMARIEPGGEATLARLPPSIRRDLDDSKRLLAFGDHTLGEAWARALVPEAREPAALVAALSHETEPQLRSFCPRPAEAQCWNVAKEHFAADSTSVSRISRHLAWLSARGVAITRVRSRIVCVGRLNAGHQAGHSRFTQDLHAMEELILELRRQEGRELVAICGKVGGISDYERFFGPLSGRLRVVLEQRRRHSAYRFPDLGELHFVQDADAHDPLVMMASLVGKYLRELLMARISAFYTSRVAELQPASGYHDPVTTRLIELTARKRRSLRIPDSCFVRTTVSDA